MNTFTRSLVVLLVLACGLPTLARVDPMPGDGKDAGRTQSIESVLPELAQFGRVRVGSLEIQTRMLRAPWKVIILHYNKAGQVDYHILTNSLRMEGKEGGREVRLHLGRGAVEGESTIFWFDHRTVTLQLPRDWPKGKSHPCRP